MKRLSLIVGPAVVVILMATAVATAGAGGLRTAASGPTRTDQDRHWVDSWASMPQLTEPGNLPPAPFTEAARVFADSTLRQTIRATVGGDQIRLRFSNAFGGAPLPITAAFLARPAGGQAGVSAIQPGSSRRLTFDGRDSISIPVGAQIVSDPLRFPVAARENLTVTLYLADGQASTSITSHPGSRTTSYMVAGDHALDADLPAGASVAHWYFLSGLEVWSTPQTAAVVVLGDSLSDGRGSTTDGNDRWPDQLLDRLQGHRDTSAVAVVNQAAGGNRVLNDGLGPNGLGRIDRDVLAQSGVAWLLVFEGVNDIGTAAATAADQQRVASDLIGAYDQIIRRAHTLGIRVYGATITPFGGNTGYDDPAGLREATRQVVNGWIRTSGRFDAVIDFDRVARDPAAPRQLLPAYDVGDHLHLNPVGYHALAEAVPARLFQRRPLPPGFGFN
jgi:lysophospholipase L1-like esterase